MHEQIEQLIAQMTLEEKVSMLAGASYWTTVPVERLRIPAIKVSDGPNGARGSRTVGGPTSVCFPVGVALAATWDQGLIRRVGVALAEETKAKGAHILLAPTVNIHRSPLAGRNFECYSEDPFLTGLSAIPKIPSSPAGWLWPTSTGYRARGWALASSISSATIPSSSGPPSARR
jgi:beta-glucosidase